MIHFDEDLIEKLIGHLRKCEIKEVIKYLMNEIQQIVSSYDDHLKDKQKIINHHENKIRKDRFKIGWYERKNKELIQKIQELNEELTELKPNNKPGDSLH